MNCEKKNRINQIKKLNMGSGSCICKDWLNIDLFTDIRPGRIKDVGGALAFHFDLTKKKLPMPKNSIKYIYASHFIEHLTLKECIFLLNECYELLKKKGVIRLVFPDLELWIQNYYENKKEFFEKYKSLYIRENKDIIKTKSEIFLSQLHGFGHKWAHDFDSVKHILKMVGFKRIQKKKVFQSKIPKINEIEFNDVGRAMESAYVEAIKLK